MQENEVPPNLGVVKHGTYPAQGCAATEIRVKVSKTRTHDHGWRLSVGVRASVRQVDARGVGEAHQLTRSRADLHVL